MTFGAADLAAAWLADALLGDPRWLPWPHPVVLIGRTAAALEAALRRGNDTPATLLVKGAVAWVAVLAASLSVAGLALVAAGRLHPALGRAIGVYLAYSCLATRCLAEEGHAIARHLTRGRLDLARTRLAGIVGRDTTDLGEAEITRAAVETIAENSSDGVIAPLFYLTLGAWLGLGPLLGVSYKAVNTLDSMFGYRNARYLHFGRVSARADDVWNWLPARLTALLTALASQLLWRRGWITLRIARRDGRRHHSPNAGFPEAAFAGALGIRIGGPNAYDGIVRTSPLIGDAEHPLRAEDLRRAILLLWALSGIGLGVGVMWHLWG